MYRPLARSHRRPPRKGTSFTLIAVSMLTLFAAVGMGYALFAHTIAKQTGANAEAQGKGGAPALELPDPTGTANRFLGSLAYGVPYDANTAEPNALTNGLRGNEPVRSVYGMDWAAISAGFPITAPFAGVGTIGGENNVHGPRGQQVNHTLVLINGQPFLLDPEYLVRRNIVSATLSPFDPNAPGRHYVNKAAGYSYADNKDFFAAVVDPVTGQVLVPSFFRYASLQGNTLAPNSPFWSTETNKLTMLRPWPTDHPNFPRIPQNADGGYSGDVQNLPGGVGPQRNDSFWMDVGAPVFLWNGKRVKALVAPLIFPLNGMLNASAHGRTGGLASHTGIGPWEVNLPLALANNGATIVTTRGTPQQRNGTNQRAFAPFRSGPLPTYSPVAWRSPPLGAPQYTRGGDDLRGEPNFNGLEFDNNPQVNHSSLFDPNQWPSTGATLNRTFPLTDVKRLHLRYAFMKEFYRDGDLSSVGVAPTDLSGTQPFVVAPGQNQAHPWRLDVAQANRLLVSPLGFDLQRPKVAPQFTRGALALALGTNKPVHPATAQVYPGPGSALAAGADFGGPIGTGTNNRWTNALAALGSVDLNRPLADYRAAANPTGALSGTNIANAAQAESDRQALARDVFVRLIAATGGAATINTANGTYTVTAAAATPEYDALRYLAQVAANAVDYIDNDDISTPFPWNPAVATDIVYGVEKPRLLINEAYGESANDPTDPVNGADDGMGGNNPPAGPMHVRFWVELTNPANVPNAPVPANDILGDGSVPLSAYRIEISRYTRTTGVAAAQDLAGQLLDPANAGFAANTTGSFDTTLVVGQQPDLKFPLAGYATTGVEPNRGVYAPAANALPANGFVLVGPEVPAKAGSDEFAPTAAAGSVWQNAIFSPNRGAAAADPQPRQAGDAASNSMAYTIARQANALNSAEFKRHVVLLRRLANPYLPEGPTNPFVTVDVMDYVPAFDAVNRFGTQGPTRGPRAAMNAGGYDPVADRFAVGKVQPFAGFATATVVNGANNFNTYGAFPRSMVQAQTAVVAGQPKHTFGRHNGNGNLAPLATTLAAGPTLTDTIMAPFDWYVHMDRPLVNATELLHLSDTAAHHVTSRFLRGNAGFTALDYEQGVGDWRRPVGLARALEFLTVKPHTVGVPHGGRVPGLINPNAMQDRRVLDAQFDPQAGNLFNPTLAPNFMDTSVWTQWMGTRSNGVTNQTAANGTSYPTANAPGTSNYDANAAGQNRPFFSLGAPAVAAGAGFAFGAGGSENDTVLRRDAQALPFLFNTAAGGPAGGYFQAEPLRKTFNTTTTVNHQYAVFFTVGYFEVGPHPTANYYQNWPTNVPVPEALGAEVYLEVPGDMRQKFASVIDLSALALDPVANAPAGPTTAGRAFAPFFTTLESTTYGPGPAVTLNVTQSSFNPSSFGGNPELFVAADGQEIGIRQNDKLVIGCGADQQIVTVTNVSNGQIQVTADSGTFRTAWGGSCVSNVRPGYAGPQSAFNYTDPRFRPVVPYVERLK